MDRRPIAVAIGIAVLLAACSGVTEATTTSVLMATTSLTSPVTTTTESEVNSTTTTEPGPVFQPVDEQLLVVGDWGSGTLPQGAVSAAMQRYAQSHDVEAILTTGDNFYSDNVDFLMQPYGWVADQGLDWWITWGNHDVESDSRVETVDEVFGSPPRWALYQWGSVDVVVLDSNQVTNLSQAAFFLSTMAESGRPMIVALHHPPFSCSHHGSTTEIVNAWVDILDDDVVLVVSGHDHSYQRFENNAITYVVTGGGGRQLRPLTDCPDNHPERLAGAELYHFVVLEQTDTTIDVTALDVNGDEIDSASIPLS